MSSRFGSPVAVLLVVVMVLLFAGTSTASLVGSGPHMADVNILLPPKMTNPLEYRLQGSDGCFKWSWDHHDILSVLPEYNVSSHCSTSARLKSIAAYSGRKETAVYATDINTGTVIRCKVYIDKFSRIQIFHNSVKLDLDGLATLRVRAFDDEDNVFSSLAGLQFMWKLMPETDGLSHSLVHVPLKDSPLGDCGGFCGDLDIQIKIENSGMFSDLFVVKGNAIGHEIVSVHLLEPQFDHMTDKIVLTVAEAMSLEPPSPVFVLIGAVVHYNLKVIRGNIPHVVTLPSPFHQWSVSNSSVAQVDAATGGTSALSLGQTTVIVEDTRVAGHILMSTLYVVLPDTLRLYLLPLSFSANPIEGIKPISSGLQWYIVSGRKYLIHVKVFSRGPEAQEIYLTRNDNVKLHDDKSEYWNTFPVSGSIAFEHGWWNSRILEATAYGLGQLTATLTYRSGYQEAKEVLKVIQEIMVCDQVKFSLGKRGSLSQSILLPWAPAIYQEVELRATGGCAKASSDYKWFSSDIATVSVSSSGVVQAKRPGKATIRVVSIFDSFNYDEVVVEVSVPSSMVILHNFPVEVVVGSYIEASVTLKASNGAYFYACDAFSSSINWDTGSELFIISNASREPLVSEKQEISDSDMLHGPPCAWTYVYASSRGRTVLHATLSKEFQHYDYSFAAPVFLKASSRIAAYSPLNVHQAGDGNQFGGYWFDSAQAETQNQLENLDHLYLAPGTCLDVKLYGGPERWDEDVKFLENVETLVEHSHPKDGVIVHQLSTHGSPYRILCHKSGSFKLVFRRGNLVGKDHPQPIVEEVALSLTCSFPSSIVILADEAANKPELIWAASKVDRSPGKIRTAPITVANGRTIRISAVGISSSGKAFGNSSSLSLRWALGNCDGLASWDDAYTLSTNKSSWERFLVLHNVSGLCIVRATVTGFIDTISHHHRSTAPETFGRGLTDAVQLQLVSTLRVNPEYNLLFFSPEAKLNISITGGSCFLQTAVNDTQIVEVIHSPLDLQCSQMVLAPKGLGTALVTVYDIGLSPPLAASSIVHVADLDWIRVSSSEEMSIMEGTLQSIHLLAGINDGNTFDDSQYVYMNIRVHIEDHIIEIVDNSNSLRPTPIDGCIRASSFIVRARYIGVTTLYVSAMQLSGHEILSHPIKIEVYAPPRLHPSDIFLVPGASYVVTVKGGPTIGAHVEFSSVDDEILTIDEFTGKLSAISPGNATIVAAVHGKGNATICQAYGRVEVGVPSSAMLNVQSEQLAFGREMPIYPSLSEGNLFSFYELCNRYEWTIKDEEVLNFSSSDDGDAQFIQVLYARSAGKTDVVVSFTCDFTSPPGTFSQSRSYTASISLWVVADLPLARGAPITWLFPPYYTTQNLLPSSSDDHTRKGTISYSLLRQCGGKNEDAENDAIHIDGSKIKTTGSNSLACIQAKDRLTGRTEVAACIKVAEVAQIRIARKISLAVDSELDITVGYCDELGNPFHEAYGVIVFDAETNYPDIVSINATANDHGIVYVKARRHGRALVKISFSSNPRKSDYMLISVGAHLYPVNPSLHIGNHLNFSVKGVNDQASGRWLSSNNSVVFIDMASGEAKSIGEGNTEVIFEGSSLKLRTTVTVLNGDYVYVDAPKEILFNVPFPAKGYKFSVKFNKAQLHSIEEASLYDCTLEPAFVGYAKPWTDIESGDSYCLFFPYSPEHLSHSVPKSKDTNKLISVSMNASVRGLNDVSGSASAVFIGGFSVLDMDKNSLQLNLTPESNTSVITVVGNTDVELNWNHHDHLLIRPIYRDDFGVGGRVKYEIKVLKTERFKDRLILTLSITGQKVEVGVEFEPGKTTRLSETARHMAATTIWAVVIGCFMVLILTVAAFLWLLDRPDSSRSQSIAPATPVVAAPATPDQIRPEIGKEHSPRTPQPFIDYVRRTIDETPYYKQDVRRRVNLQNTY